mmetsp:Transcript_97631/g.188275  ORF Transcript_97631/g.188275 Transcript_97631/m.188275 type:complete len:228 (+) Transcript_97631:54-737(+)|eukprot:CAMPEP_0172728416 /NCGR_PEP_ID=MMETSP1074-20121228/92230_1 /TAXON_ID=2916 /ORGANISM="Ceratium fusus, Strain PA161109" /LENGTH=227 /DNA_ID=CAMNT_0013555663 /DNA_START=51 /DNA_END=734 /DNA_ORIENTATION=+
MSYAQSSKQGSNEASAVGNASGSRLGTALGTAGNQQTLKQADNRTEAEMLASARRSLAEAQAVSNRTLGTLNEQTEQLHRITAGAEDVSNNLEKSEFLLQSLKPLGWVKNIFKKDPVPCRGQVVTSNLPSTSAAPSAPSAPSKAVARMQQVDERTRQAQKNGSSRPDQVDKAYDELEHMLDGLKHSTLEINRTLDQHNEMVPRIERTVESNQERVKKQEQELRKQLK